MGEDYDYLFKSIVVGDGGVGKTALTLRFSKGFFTEDYKMTIGVDFHVKTISVDSDEGEIRAKLQIWDTGGQERFSSIRPMYYRGSLGALLIFDLTSVASFEHLPQWIEEIRANIQTDIPLLLVGNKSDLVEQRAISIEEINEFTRDFNLYYMETSAKTGDNVGDCFYILATLMIGSGVPDKLIAEDVVYAPGKIPTSAAPQEASAPSTPELELDSEFEAPPVPEPMKSVSSENSETVQSESALESEYEPPPIPEPQPKEIIPQESVAENKNLQTSVDQKSEDDEYSAPPIPERVSSTQSESPSEVDSVPVPEPELDMEDDDGFFSKPIQAASENEEYEAPPVPEPSIIKEIKSESTQEIDPEIPIPQQESTSEPQVAKYSSSSDEFEFKTPDQIITEESKVKKQAQEFQSLPESPEIEASETFKPKTVPFSTNAPVPTPAPKDFQTSEPTHETETPQEESSPFYIPKSSGESSKKKASDSLFDYMPSPVISEGEEDKKKKKKKKRKRKDRKTEEKEETPLPSTFDQTIANKQQEQTASSEKGSSLFDTLKQKSTSPSQSPSQPFVPFTPGKEEADESQLEPKEEESTSQLRIIPNVENIPEEQPSSNLREIPAQTSKPQPQSIQEPQASQQTQPTMRVCPNCGAHLSNEYAFCNKCGTKL